MPLIERYFAGKTAAISGAGDGIGRALSQRLNAAGCHLWLSDINPETLAETCASLDDARGRVTSQEVDCGQRDELFSWAEAQGSVSGLVSACPAAGFVLGPISGGFLYQYYQPTAGWGAVLILLIVFAVTLRPRKDPVLPQT